MSSSQSPETICWASARAVPVEWVTQMAMAVQSPVALATCADDGLGIDREGKHAVDAIGDAGIAQSRNQSHGFVDAGIHGRGVEIALGGVAASIVDS